MAQNSKTRRNGGQKFNNKNNGKFKTGGRDFKSKDRLDDGSRSQSPNDWSWYVRSPQLVKDVASISYNNALGAGFTLNEDQEFNTGYVQGATLRMPGIMGIYTIPTPGFSNSPDSPINIAAKNFYVWIRHQNSGHANYESTDLMMYLIAMDSVYAWIQHCMRMYGIARVYSQRNRYIGDALLRTCGVDPSNLRANLANFRAAVNMLIVKASAFCTPRTMTLYNRHMWMYSGVYKDSDIDKSQMYMYLPALLYRYTETTPGGGKLVATRELVTPVGDQLTRDSAKTAAWFINEGSAMLAALQQSEDINIMSGDILKAYGRENLNSLAFMPEDYVVTPIYSEEILDQIHNTTMVGAFPRTWSTLTSETAVTADISCFDVNQVASEDLDSYITITPSVINAPYLSLQHLCDMWDNDPTPERTIVATRNMVGAASMPENIGTSEAPLTRLHTRLNSFGSDLCLFAIVVFEPVGGNGRYYYKGDDLGNGMTDELQKFNRAPLIYKGTTDISTGKYQFNSIAGDINNFTVLSASDLKEMHESAILSQFGVPI